MNNNKRLGHFPSKAPSFNGEVIPCIRCDKDIKFYAGAIQSYYVTNDSEQSAYCEALVIRHLLVNM